MGVIDGLSESIATFGLATVLVFVLLWVVWKLWRDLVTLTRDQMDIVKENTKVMTKLAERLKGRK